MRVPSSVPRILVPRLQPGNAGPQSSASKPSHFYQAWPTDKPSLEGELPGSASPGWSLGTRGQWRPLA